MKINRRGFLTFSLGVLAGAPLTPLPWKLLDDTAIWTQARTGAAGLSIGEDLTYASTVCTLCPGGCGIKIRLADKARVIRAEGLNSAPVNQGGICPIGAASSQYHYGLARITGPMKRIGDRGKGRFKPISWNEALASAGGRLAQSRDAGRPFSTLLINGRGNSLVNIVAKRFMLSYGSPNLVNMPSMDEAAKLAALLQFGSKTAPSYDLENSDYVLSFGASVIEGWGSPVRSIKAHSIWKRNRTRFIQVQARFSPTAAKADDWVAIKPGTETTLALSLAQVLVSRNLYDKEFVHKYGHGLEAFKSMLNEEYTPAKASKVCGLSPDRIVRLAKEFAFANAPVALSGQGAGSGTTPLYEMMAVNVLNFLIGNINRTGGMGFVSDPPLWPWPEIMLDKTAQAGTRAPRLDSFNGPLKYEAGNLSLLASAVSQANYYPADTMIFLRANPAYFGPDPQGFRKAMAKTAFLVSLSPVMDETTALCDLILPESGNLEGPADVINPPTLPFPVFGAAGPILNQPFYNTKPAGDILINLANRLGGSVKESLPWDSYVSMIRQRAVGLYKSGQGRLSAGEEADAVKVSSIGSELDFFKTLSKGRFWYDQVNFKADTEPEFSTPSGKFEFLSQKLKNDLASYLRTNGQSKTLAAVKSTQGGNHLYMPHQEPALRPEANQTFGLLLVVYEHQNIPSGHLGAAPFFSKLISDRILDRVDYYVQLNPETAQKLDLANNQKAWLATEQGGIKVRLDLSSETEPGVVLAPLGLGRTALGRYWKDKGQNPLEIVKAVIDPISSQALFMAGTPASLSRL